MKNRWNKLLVLFGIFATASVWSGSMLCAQNFERMPDFEQKLYGEYAHVSADYETMTAIKRYWYQEGLKLKNRKCSYALTGSNDCVFKVTFSTSDLFCDNDTVLSASGVAILTPFLDFLTGPDAIAKGIVATFTDNNGSPRYLTQLSGARSRNVAKWLIEQGVSPDQVRSFGHGNKASLNANKSIVQRRANRRVSLYFVPTKKMIKFAKKGTLGQEQGAKTSTIDNLKDKINIKKIWQKN